ncbi:MAG: MFS transporter [Gemmatales bacterium]|nr:MFS transporter [Gemmatales bacterium]MDW8385408.1 MFS transporter [Gemmatales bacterium]
MPAESSAESVAEEGCSSPTVAASVVRHNLIRESVFSAFTGVFMGMILFAAPVIAYSALNASALELTIIVSAFPCGAFLGPLWASLGRRWGMQRLVLNMAMAANLPLFLMFWVQDSLGFTLLVTLSQLLHSAMRMGQSSLYRASYPREYLGRVIGLLTFCTFATMIPTTLLAGWLVLPENWPDSYRWLYPLSALAGLFGCLFYRQIRLLETPVMEPPGKTWEERLQDIGRVLVQDRVYLLFQTAFFLAGSAFFLSMHIVLKLSKDRLHFSSAELALWLSVLPQAVLAVSTLVWGRFLNRLGIVQARLVIGVMMAAYLSCYFLGIALGVPTLIYLGSILRGFAEGGGQVTWSLASVHFAPRAEDVPVYNGIHFVLNGIRGLLMPAVGTALYMLSGEWLILFAAAVAAVSSLVAGVCLRYDHEALASKTESGDSSTLSDSQHLHAA